MPAEHAQRQKATVETEFCGSWTLRKFMREKAMRDGAMSLKEVVEMEKM
jgi:hypothetical protein